MRNPNRIDDFMFQLGQIWKNYFPDWRFGQLIANFIREYGDPFYLEEDMFIEKMNEFVAKYSK